jgi:hypothetical protein
VFSESFIQRSGFGLSRLEGFLPTRAIICQGNVDHDAVVFAKLSCVLVPELFQQCSR